MRFLINVIDSDPAKPADSSEMAAIDAFNQELQDGGNWIYAWGLESISKAKLVDNTLGQESIQNRPLHEGQESISGFWLIETHDEKEALDLALKGSKACNRRVELRPLHQ